MKKIQKTARSGKMGLKDLSVPKPRIPQGNKFPMRMLHEIFTDLASAELLPLYSLPPTPTGVVLGGKSAVEQCISHPGSLPQRAALLMVSSVMKKYPWTIPGIDRKQAAIDAFTASEQQCRRYNTYNGKSKSNGITDLGFQIYCQSTSARPSRPDGGLVTNLKDINGEAIAIDAAHLGTNPGPEPVLATLRKEIASILPPLPEKDPYNWAFYCEGNLCITSAPSRVTLSDDGIRYMTYDSRHGPGASLGHDTDSNSVYSKNVAWPYTCTRLALPHAIQMIKDDPRWLGALENSYREAMGIAPWKVLDQEKFWSDVIKIVPGNRITTVPKTALTDRTIAIEPKLNMMLQLGVDGVIRRHLKRFGIDLNSQVKSINLAREGSIGDHLATIDLEAASDTVSLRICRLLLPGPWYRYLCDLRSPTGIMPDGTRITYRKISSMGNGYTFALEALIFYACIRAAAKQCGASVNIQNIAVIGDDLVVPNCIMPATLAILQMCGFKCNQTKTFVSGPFRESCGGDWYSGVYVRPPMFDRAPKTVQDLVVFHNKLVLWELEWGRPDLLLRSRKYLLDLVPPGFLVFGPVDMRVTDGWFFLHWDDNGREPKFPTRMYRRQSRLYEGNADLHFLKLNSPLKAKPRHDVLLEFESSSSIFDIALSSRANVIRLVGLSPREWSLWPVPFRPFVERLISALR